MDKDKIDGRTKELKGSMKEAMGKLIGNNSLRAEGAAEKTAGKAQGAVGTVKDKVRGLFKK